MNIIFIVAGCFAGVLIGWGISAFLLKSKSVSKSEFDSINSKLNEVITQFSVEQEKKRQLEVELSRKKAEVYELRSGNSSLIRTNADLGAKIESKSEAVEIKNQEILQLKSDLREKTDEFNAANTMTAELKAKNSAFAEKLELQKKELEEMSNKVKTEFENIAAKILDDKTLKFTEHNQENLKNILNPLSENLVKFKERVEEVYHKEANERFSLGKEVEKLVVLNQQISKEASNLTHALKGDSKTQGDWGEMILESILEQSGLTKDREYFIQETLRDEDGNTIKNDDSNIMRPDVVIAYPDERKVIVDSKVSLTAYSKYCDAEDPTLQKKFLAEHIKSIRKHIDELSYKSYQDFTKSLDFVMMFVPNEPAYLVALKNDHEIWSYAYRKRVILISPTNLIAALKLINDLWKREYQNQNAQKIAERGALLYDKFAGFVETLQKVGINLEKASNSYNDAFKQLKDGQGNLIRQAEMLRDLGVHGKKKLPVSLIE